MHRRHHDAVLQRDARIVIGENSNVPDISGFLASKPTFFATLSGRTPADASVWLIA
jgi:hypothetical protein